MGALGRPRCLRTRTWSAVPAARHHRERPAPPAVVPRVAAGPSARWLALASWRLALLPHWTAARAAVVGYSRSSQPPAPRFPVPRAAGALSLAGFVRHQDSTDGGPQKHRSQLNKKKLGIPMPIVSGDKFTGAAEILCVRDPRCPPRAQLFRREGHGGRTSSQ